LPVGAGEWDRGLALEKLNAETRADVPRDVTVQQPGARVVRRESDDDPALAGEEGCITAGWVLEVEVRGVGLLVEDVLQQQPSLPTV